MDENEIPYEVPPEERGRRHVIPPRERPADDNGYFAILTQAVFQAGFSWQVVRNKWPAFQRAFNGFALDRVAAYDAKDVERLLNDEGIVRNARKIEATIENAQKMQDICAEYGSFYDYLRSLDGLSYPQRSAELASQFKWLGRTGAFFFLFRVDEEVPDWANR
jgi:3-methyladenine DNA glycosylase Tag